MNMRRYILACLGALCVGMLLAACSTAASVQPTATPHPTDTPPPTITPTSPPEPTATATSPRTFVIVPEESEVRYTAEEEFFQGAVDRLGMSVGTNAAVGRTNAIEGSVTVVPGTAPQIEGGTFKVDLRELESDQGRRDRWLREQYFSSFPTAEFTATEIEGFPATYEEGQTVEFQLVGDMSLFIDTLPLTFDVEMTLNGDTMSGTATTFVVMEEYGLPPPSIFGIVEVTDGITVTVDFTARENS